MLWTMNDTFLLPELSWRSVTYRKMHYFSLTYSGVVGVFEWLVSHSLFHADEMMCDCNIHRRTQT
jgi:hypothetical protein